MGRGIIHMEQTKNAYKTLKKEATWKKYAKVGR
jgi:hypothetical protein